MAKDCTPNVPAHKPGAPSGASAASANDQTELLQSILTELQNPRGIESSFAPVGCIFDETTGEVVGKVMACKKVTSAGVFQSVELIGIRINGVIERPYIGPWAECGDCSTNTARGAVSSWG